MAFLRVVRALCLVLGPCGSFNLDATHPIIYGAPNGDRDSYFGMSVAIRPRAAVRNDSWTIQIGAPRGNAVGDDARRPGAVYRCHVRGPCRRLLLDGRSGAVGGQGLRQYKEKRDDAWIGVSTDVVDSGACERSVVCGHRWINENLKNPENIDITYLMTGICYLQDIFNSSFETPHQKLLPLVNKDKIYTPKPYVVDLSTYHWGLGQAGLSLRLTKNASEVLIGAPGVTHWIGSVVRYGNGLRADVGHFAKTEVARKSRYAYLGYSVAVGRFYKDRELWYVAGAPRSANYRGEVFTFQYELSTSHSQCRPDFQKAETERTFTLQGSSEDIRLRSNFAGATFGEYFGASLATADLNSDSFDDLVVGAPLFSGNGVDGGRIYVYLGTGRGNFLVPAQTVSGPAGEGRFGYCVSSVEDLDGDGYSDVAVGAPYEEGGGAVYVYRGFAKGLRTEPSQRIRGGDVYPNLRGFGASISSAVDVDGNHYKDVAVGSYLSGHVVLLRSRPVVSLHPYITAENTSLIDRKDSHFNVTVCSRFVGSDAPEYVDIVRILDVDPVHGRATLDQRTSIYRKSIRLRRNGITCEHHSVLLDLSEKNYSPIQITVRNEIGPCMGTTGSMVTVQGEKSEGKDTFSPSCPIAAKTERMKEIAFAGICGPDLTCRSDLEIFCSLLKFSADPYVLGSTDPLGLSIEVRNHGEPAYHTRIKIWSDLELKYYDRKGDATEDAPRQVFWIEAEALLTESYGANITFQIDLDSLNKIGQRHQLNVIAEIFTSSLEANLKNNKCRLSLALLGQTHLDFYASSSLSSAYVTDKTLRQAINVTHYYEVQRTGVTPPKDTDLTIYIPFSQKGFLSFEIETAEWMHLSDAFQGASPRDIPPQDSDNCPPSNRTIFVNCSSPDFGCNIFKVFFTGEIPVGLSSYVKIVFSLNISALGIGQVEEDIVHVTTSGVLRWRGLLEKEPRELRRSASVSVYEEERGGQVDGRVVGLSVLAGGFLLCLIVTGLARRNFFRRVKKQELEALRDAEASFVFFKTADVQSCVSQRNEN